jgi:hypothetical protein
MFPSGRNRLCNFRAVHARQVMCVEHFWETVIELTTGDVTSGLRRPLEAEMDKRQLLTCQKKQSTYERYTIDSKHEVNSYRKPRSTNRLMT